MERSKRKRIRPVRFSPTPTSQYQIVKEPKKVLAAKDDSVYGDVLVDGSLFLCEKCSSTFLDTRSRGTRRKVNIVHPTVRYTETGDKLILCRTCGTQHDQLQVSANVPTDPPLSVDEVSPPVNKEMEEFISSIHTKTNIPQASLLICYNPSKRCHCMASYLKSLGPDDLVKEVRSLLIISLRASELLKLKVDDLPAGSKTRKVGLGNGKKRSKLYESYVLKEREKLRDNLNLCEHTVQKLLYYSNNFLHKQLVTEQKRTRIGRKQKNRLLPVTSLWKHQCCRDNCTRVTRTHLNLVARWRQLSMESRRGLQQAVAELLIPSAGAKTNCYSFITMVTGSSTATIAKVTKKMRENGGVLGMHEHGLVKYWKSKREADNEEESSDEELSNVWAPPQHHAEEVELRQMLDKQAKQLQLLKAQVREQQAQIDQQKDKLNTKAKKSDLSNHQPPSINHSSWRFEGQLGSDNRAFASNNWKTGNMSASPQYPYKSLPNNRSSTSIIQSPSSSAKPLLQPSRLDSPLRQRQQSMKESDSYVIATEKPLPASTQLSSSYTLLQDAYHYNYNNYHLTPNIVGKQSENTATNTFFSQQTSENITQLAPCNSSQSLPVDHTLLPNEMLSSITSLTQQTVLIPNQYYTDQNQDIQSWGYSAAGPPLGGTARLGASSNM